MWSHYYLFIILFLSLQTWKLVSLVLLLVLHVLNLATPRLSCLCEYITFWKKTTFSFWIMIYALHLVRNPQILVPFIWSSVLYVILTCCLSQHSWLLCNLMASLHVNDESWYNGIPNCFILGQGFLLQERRHFFL